VLHFFEVIFRNTCNELIIFKTNNKKWYLDKNVLENLTDNSKYNFINIEFGSIIRKLRENKEAKELINIDNINQNDFIANAGFGFWIELFNKKRAYKIYNKFFNYCFSKNNLNRRKVKKILENIRFFRNRIAHQECIIKYDYEKVYYDMTNIIDFISNDTYSIVKEICNFEVINRYN
jgi:hypothetical protein